MQRSDAGWCQEFRTKDPIARNLNFSEQNPAHSALCTDLYYGSKIRNYSGNFDKIYKIAPKYSRFEKTSIKFYINCIFTMWEGSVENLYQQIGSYQLFTKRSVQEHSCAGLCSEKLRFLAIGLMKWSVPNTENYLY